MVRTRKTSFRSKTTAQQPMNETRRERRRRLREEYDAALDDFTSYHPDNVTRAYMKARDRLDQAEKNLRRWHW